MLPTNWVRYAVATSRKVAGSIPDVETGGNEETVEHLNSIVMVPFSGTDVRTSMAILHL
jgi:hypothetical protein